MNGNTTLVRLFQNRGFGQIVGLVTITLQPHHILKHLVRILLCLSHPTVSPLHMQLHMLFQIKHQFSLSVNTALNLFNCCLIYGLGWLKFQLHAKIESIQLETGILSCLLPKTKKYPMFQMQYKIFPLVNFVGCRSKLVKYCMHFMVDGRI